MIVLVAIALMAFAYCLARAVWALAVLCGRVVWLVSGAMVVWCIVEAVT